MKQYFKKVLLLLCMFVMVFSISAAAAPAKVKTLKASSKDNVITLKWSKVSGAKGYNIYLVDTTTGTAKKYKSTTKTTYTISKATYYKKYTFKVCAYDKKKKEGAFSETASVTITPITPNAPSNFRVSSYGDKSVTLKWSTASKASGYIIEYYNEDTASYETIKTIKTRTTKKTTLSKLTPDETYQFRITSYRNVAGKTLYSTPSKVVSATISEFSSEVKSVRTARYKAVTKKAVTVTVSGKKQTVKVAKGVSLTTTSKSSGYVTAYLKNGTKVKIHSSALKFTGLDSSSKNDYTKSTKEKYVNAKGYKSKTGYFIWVSQYKLKVNVFKGSKGNWKLEKVFPCVVGKWRTRTPNGMHRIIKSIRNGDYGGPYMYFTNGASIGGTDANPIGCAFHNQVDSTMSKAASHGCCRLYLKDLLWLYNHCKVGTAVLVY